MRKDCIFALLLVFSILVDHCSAEQPDSQITVLDHETSANLLNATVSANTCRYSIVIVTGCRDSAGTDARVRISLYNANSNGVSFSNLDNGGDAFEKCKTDTFNRNGNCLSGRPCKMVLSHDNSGKKSGWYVERVQVTVSDYTAFFPVNRWLASDESPYSLTAIVDRCPRAVEDA